METYKRAIGTVLVVTVSSGALVHHLQHQQPIYVLPEDSHGHAQERERQELMAFVQGAFDTRASASATGMSLRGGPPDFMAKL